MAEFDRCDKGMIPGRILADGRQLPVEFSAEEAVTAHWLNDHYNVTGENLPPRYVQTLLGDPRQAPATDDFEAHITATVFARLHIERPAPSTNSDSHSLGARLRANAERLAQRISRQGTVVIMALVMLFSYNALGTGVALASVLQLFAGHGGTQAVVNYPTLLTTNHPVTTTLDYGLHFQPQWSGASLEGFSFANMDVYPAQWWSDGALMNLHYLLQDASGVHRLDVLEFMPHARYAMQVVQDGAATDIPIGNSHGIFVAGQWSAPLNGRVWRKGNRSELILSDANTNGPVIWIATNIPLDQTATQWLLTQFAKSMQTFQYSSVAEVAETTTGMRLLSGTMATNADNLFGNDVIALIGAESTPNASVLYIPIDPTLAPMSAGQQGDGT